MGERSGEGAGEGIGRIAVLGLGASGMAAARLALEKGGEVHVSDLRTEPEVAAGADELRALGADVELGAHDESRIAAADTVVVSPGIPPDAPVLAGLRARGVRWISEPEFGVRFLPGALIAVTGTNGKTTTAALAAHLLEAGGVRTGLGGNIGADFGPAASLLALRDPPPEWSVLEVSSFQLADIDRFRPDVGVVTNLAPDHLDRYDSVEAYYADKGRIFENATPESRWVLPGDQPEVDRLAGDAPGERYRFSLRERPVRGGWVEEGTLVLDVGHGPEPLLPTAELPLLGAHNRANALAAALTARLAGVDAAQVAEGIRTFRPLPHRLEAVRERDGVLWVNDSKATNVSAAVGALESLDRPLVVLLGGKDKGEDLRPLGQALERRAEAGRLRAAVLFGAARERLERELPRDLPIRRVEGGLDEAVRAGAAEALSGDALLLAPACSSYDEFGDYRERGERFRSLAGGGPAGREEE